MTGVVVATVIMVVVAASAALATAAAAGRGARAAAEDERGNTPAGRREVTYDGRALILDGARRMLFSGDMHYPRSTPEVRRWMLMVPIGRIVLMQSCMRTSCTRVCTASICLRFFHLLSGEV